MQDLKGKCKDCIGCNLLEDIGFKGREHCKYYIKDNRVNWTLIIGAIIELLMIGLIFIGFYNILKIFIGG